MVERRSQRMELAGRRAAFWAAPCQSDASFPGETLRVGAALARLGCRVDVMMARERFLQLLREEQVDLIVAGVCRCHREPLDLLEQAQRNPKLRLPPVLLLAGAEDSKEYLEGMRRGAFDCVAVPVAEKELIRIVAQALASGPLRRTA